MHQDAAGGVADLYVVRRREFQSTAGHVGTAGILRPNQSVDPRRNKNRTRNEIRASFGPIVQRTCDDLSYISLYSSQFEKLADVSCNPMRIFRLIRRATVREIADHPASDGFHRRIRVTDGVEIRPRVIACLSLGKQC